MTVIVFYTIALGVNFLIFFNFICRKEYQSELNFFISLALLLRSYGQLRVAGAETLEVALFADKVFYFGSAFLPTFLFLAVARLGKIKLPKIIEGIAMLYSTIIMLLALTIGKSKIYYSEVYLVHHSSGYVTIGKEYGPLHFLYTLMMICYAVGFAWLLFKAFKNKNSISRRVITTASYMAIIVIVFYAVGRFVETEISLTSVVYLIATIVCIRVMADAEIHDLNGCILEAMNGNEDEGVVVFDANEKFINSNEKAREIYPEIKDLLIGKPVPQNFGPFYKQIASRVKELKYDMYNPEDNEIIQVGDRKYEVNLNEVNLRSGDEAIGTFVEIEDVTIRENIAEVEARYSKELEEDVEKKSQEIKEMQRRLVLGLATLVESRDSSTGEHIVRTERGIKIFADQLKESDKMKLDPLFLTFVCEAMPMHDLGKIAIDDDVLKAEGNYTPEQEKIIRTHTEEGAKIVRKILAGINITPEENRFTEVAVNIANYHHERWDGSGYPAGLRGKEIPMEARIASFIDAVDSFIDENPSKENVTFDQAFDSVVNGIGTKFDPDLGAEFVKCRQKLKEIYRDLCNERIRSENEI